jgi:hypothetical protein
MPYKIDFDFSKAGYFIDCDTFINDLVVWVFRIGGKTKILLSRKGKIESLSIAQVEQILRQFEIAQAIKRCFQSYTTRQVSRFQRLQREQTLRQALRGYIESDYLIGATLAFDDIQRGT